MIKNLLDLERGNTGKIFDIYIKPFGNRIYSDGTILKKTKSYNITKLDRLLSDLYTIPESYVEKSGILPVGYYTYNHDTKKIISENEVLNHSGSVIHIAPIMNYTFDNGLYKLARMNHVNSILSAVGYDQMEHKSLIKSLIFKYNEKPVFKIKIRDGKKLTIEAPLLKMMANMFFYGNPVQIQNVFNDRVDAIVSITNQIFNAKYNRDIDIDSKMHIYPHMQIQDINSKISMLQNKRTQELLHNNPMSYYLYMILLILIVDKGCDNHIEDTGILCNLKHYRDKIASKPTMLSFEKFESCQA